MFRAMAAIGRAVVLCNVVAFVYIAYTLMLCGFIISYSETRFPNPRIYTITCSVNLVQGFIMPLTLIIKFAALAGLHDTRFMAART